MRDVAGGLSRLFPKDWIKLTAEEQKRLVASHQDREKAMLHIGATGEYTRGLLADTFGDDNWDVEDFRNFVERRHGMLWVMIATLRDLEEEVAAYADYRMVQMGGGA